MMQVRPPIQLHLTEDNMKTLIKSISEKNYDGAKSQFNEAIQGIAEKKMYEMKKMIMAKEQSMSIRKAFDGGPQARAEKLERGVVEEEVIEEAELDEARVKIVKARVRGGVIQRRKKVSNVPGMTIRSGRLIRMSPMERRKRKMGQRRGKIKRKAKMARTLMKRQRSLRKRASIGL